MPAVKIAIVLAAAVAALAARVDTHQCRKIDRDIFGPTENVTLCEKIK